MIVEVRKIVLEINIKDGDDFVIFFIIVVWDGKLDFVKVFLSYEVNIEVCGMIKIDGEIINGCIVLWVVVCNGNFVVVRFLIE